MLDILAITTVIMVAAFWSAVVVSGYRQDHAAAYVYVGRHRLGVVS